MGARLLKVIESDETSRGDGRETITRQIVRYFDEGGQLLAERDAIAPLENGHVLDALQRAFQYVRQHDPDGGDARQLAVDLLAGVRIMKLREYIEPETGQIPK